MPKRPDSVEEQISKAIKGKVPYFFMEAKGKDRKNVAEINKSTVNRLRKVIPNRNIKFEEIAGVFDYKMLMSEDVEYVNRKVVKTYNKLDRSKKWILNSLEIGDKREQSIYLYKYIKDELFKIEKDECKIVNSLVKSLHSDSSSPHKETLWKCYGDILLANLREKLKGTKQCESCGERIEIYNTKKYCESCSEIVRKEQVRLNMIKYRKKKNRYKNDVS